MRLVIKNAIVYFCFIFLFLPEIYAENTTSPTDSLKTKKAKWDAFISFDLPHRDFVYDKNNADAVNCANLPQNQEHFRLNYSVGFLRNIKINTKLMLQAGLNYENIRFFTDTVLSSQHELVYSQYVYNNFNLYLGLYSSILRINNLEIGISFGSNLKLHEETFRTYADRYSSNFSILSKYHDFFINNFDLVLKFPVISISTPNKKYYISPNFRYSLGYSYSNNCTYFENGEYKFLRGRMTVKGIAIGMQF